MTWDGTSTVQVEVQDAMKDKVCGICGNFDGNADNDWTVGNTELCMTKFPDAQPGEVVSRPYSTRGFRKESSLMRL